VRFDAKPGAAASVQTGVARALQRLKQARLIEAEALGEIIVAIAPDNTTVRVLIPETPRGEQNGSPSSKDGGYLSVKQLVQKIPYAEKTLRNFIGAGELIEGRHYFKRRGRLMFSWSAIQEWVEKRGAARFGAIPLVRSRRHGRSS